MCFNVSIKTEQANLENIFNAKFEIENQLQLNYHLSAFNHPVLPVITNENKNFIQFFNWGLIPSWAKDETAAKEISNMTLNAKAETIFEKPSFRESIYKRRCLILVDGFYEWHHHENKKYPFYIFLKNKEPFSLGGIWDTWTNKINNQQLKTFSIVTTLANSLMAKIHNTKKRMPLILEKQIESDWLDSSLKKESISKMLKPFDENLMEAFPVANFLSSSNKIKNQTQLTIPFDYGIKFF